MKLFEKIKNAITKRETASLNDERFMEWLGLQGTSQKKISEATYFTCLKMLSETLGKMPIKFYQKTQKGIEEALPNEIFLLLKTRPNPQMTPTTFWGTVENNRNHYEKSPLGGKSGV